VPYNALQYSVGEAQEMIERILVHRESNTNKKNGSILSLAFAGARGGRERKTSQPLKIKAWLISVPSDH
jgi:hypothetical protein